jgi:nucleotide-binding universal stress UspA family protein
MYKRILVCLDGSKLSESILPHAIQQALQFGSKLILMQVMNIPGFVSASTAEKNDQPGDLVMKEIQIQKQGIEEYLKAVAEQIFEKGIETEIEVLYPASFGDAIVNYAKNNKIDLICIATHGYRGISRVVFGSVADYVLKNSCIPILIVKPEELTKKLN